MIDNIPYIFTENLVLRTPALPFPTVIDEELIINLLNNHSFLEAIYLASPVLYHEYMKWKKEEIKSEKEIQKIKLSLVKYFQRMSSRCTPFGLFSGCSVVKWKDEKTRIVFDETSSRRQTRLDMHYCCALSQKLTSLPGLKEKLLFYPNSSIYELGDELRYVEYKYEKGRRMHQISSVANSEYLRSLLQNAASGIRLEEAKKMLLHHDITDEEATEFIEELLSSQILVSELEPSITGTGFASQLIDTLNKYAADSHSEWASVRSTLEEIQKQIGDLDTFSKEDISGYKEIISLLQGLPVEYDESKIFQTDLFKTPLSHAVNKNLQARLVKALGFFNKLYPESSDENLKSFSKRFTERYEDRTMPLPEVLDSETGIGYLEGRGKTLSPLIDGLTLSPEANNHSIYLNKKQEWIFEILKNAHHDNSYAIQLTDHDLNELEAGPGLNKKSQPTSWNTLPPSLAVMFRIVNTEESAGVVSPSIIAGESDKILIESIGGASAANLLGRFAHGDDNIYKMICEITAKEQELNPEIIFAEIIHLPEDRVGNVLLHPVFRDYEIPYLARSSVNKDCQVFVNDLLVSVEGNQIKLFSTKLNKQIIPRLSTAHNFSANALPVYQFLCDLQSQNLRHGFSFHWGNLAGLYAFLPRVEYGDLILSEATWQFKRKDFEAFLLAIEQDNSTALENFISRWKLPRYFVLADRDNELLTDTQSKLSLQAFAKTIKNRSSIILKEFLFDSSPSITNQNGECYVNQFVAPLVKTEKVYSSAFSHPDEQVAGTIQNKFVPGSEWLYYKFYCGPASAEKILAEIIEPITSKLLLEKKISKWFFVRYHDPHFHLRVRFHLADKNSAGPVMNEISAIIEDPQYSQFIWNTQLDTYQRESERYGAEWIGIAEEIFYFDSLNKLKFLELTDGDERENIRWLWGLRSTDEFLNALAYTLEQKQALLLSLKESFSKEFNADKSLLLRVNKKYNDNREAIRSVMADLVHGEPGPYAPVITESLQFKEMIRSILKTWNSENFDRRAGTKFKETVTSYIHMSMNRLFPSQQRLQEYILYEFLNRWYVSLLKQQNGKMDGPS